MLDELPRMEDDRACMLDERGRMDDERARMDELARMDDDRACMLDDRVGRRCASTSGYSPPSPPRSASPSESGASNPRRRSMGR
jgi:hypothetical protein